MEKKGAAHYYLTPPAYITGFLIKRSHHRPEQPALNNAPKKPVREEKKRQQRNYEEMHITSRQITH